METRANQNWVRAYDWQGRKQGSEPAVYRVERWRPSLLWRVMHQLGVV